MPVSRKNEMMNNFLLPGLQDLCVSRSSFKWGIPVDFDDRHVVYVWLDALTNYITGLGFDADGGHDDLYRKYWPADLHLIGKDIIRFHTIYWPIFLMSLDLPLPKQVFGHPWLLMGDGKMSKSKGNVIYADDLVSLFGVDAVRYFVLHEMPFENDGVITWDLVVERVNSDLANILGNLVNRTIAMSNKYFGGVLEDAGAATDPDDDLKQTVLEAVKKTQEKMDVLRVADALTAIFEIFRRSNKYIDETEPWKLAKDPEHQDRLKTVLYNLAESITIGASLLKSFMPETSEKILAQLSTSPRTLEEMDRFGLLKSGTKVTEKPEILFARQDIKEVMEKVEKIRDAQKQPEAPKLEHLPEITIDAFMSSEIRVVKVLNCEKVPKADKLLKFTLFDGERERTVVSGIAQYYKPEELIGRKLACVVNLAPHAFRGIVSEGMLLCSDAEGSVRVLTIDDSVPEGSRIR